MTVLLNGPRNCGVTMSRHCGVTMSRYNKVARPESMRYNYWGHVSELPDMWPAVKNVADLQKLFSSPVNIKGQSPENWKHFLCRINAGENINVKPLAEWTMAIRISQVPGTEKECENVLNMTSE